MPRRQTRPRVPNQRTCRHDFIRVMKKSEHDEWSLPNPGEISRITRHGRTGNVVQCPKCALVRTLWSDGTMVDGGISRNPPEPELPRNFGTMIGGVQYAFPTTPTINTINTLAAAERASLGGGNAVAPTGRGRTAAQRLDDHVAED